MMSSANSDRFISSFPILIPFISFSSLIAVTRTSKTMLKSSGECEYPCLVPQLSGKSFSFSPLRMNVSYGFVIYGLYYVEVGSLYAHFLEGFLSEMGVGFCQKLFLRLLRGSYGFYSSFC